MKLVIVLFVCAFQCINGDKDTLNQAIKNGNEEIVKDQKAWEASIQGLRTAVNDANSEFSAEFDTIADLVKDKADKSKAFADFKVAYENYITEIRSYIAIVLSEGPKSISESFNPSHLAEEAYGQILNGITALESGASGNTCKENMIEKIQSFAVGTITNTTKCILNGIDSIQNFRADIDYLTAILSPIAKSAIAQLKLCTEEEGTICFDNLTDSAKSQFIYLKTSVKNFPEEFGGVITLEKEVTNTCISQVKATFDTEIKTTSKKIRKC